MSINTQQILIGIKFEFLYLCYLYHFVMIINKMVSNYRLRSITSNISAFLSLQGIYLHSGMSAQKSYKCAISNEQPCYSMSMIIVNIFGIVRSKGMEDLPVFGSPGSEREREGGGGSEISEEKKLFPKHTKCLYKSI